MNSIRPADYLAALFPSFAALTLADWNHIVAISCALLGACYLICKWVRETRG